jgi:CheY-like chemotaxis protein
VTVFAPNPGQLGDPRPHRERHPQRAYEATRRIKADPELRAIPIVVVTSYALSGDDAKAREAGCDAYVAKPFSPRALLGTIRQFLAEEG